MSRPASCPFFPSKQTFVSASGASTLPLSFDNYYAPACSAGIEHDQMIRKLVGIVAPGREVLGKELAAGFDRLQLILCHAHRGSDGR